MSIIAKIKKNIWAASLVLVRIAVGLSMQKIIALKYGPVGTTLFSHFQNFISLFTQPFQDIIGQGVVTGIANKKFNNKKVIVTATIFSIIVLATLLLAVFIFLQFKPTTLSFLNSYWLIILACLFLLAFKLIAINFLVAKDKLKVLFSFTLIEWMLIILIIYTSTDQLVYTLLWYLAIQGLSTFLYFTYIFISTAKLFPITIYLDAELKNHFLQFLLIGITIWTSSKLTDFYVRSFAIESFPEMATGLWQAVARISTAYKALFISISMLSFFPLIAKADNLQQRRKELLNYLKIYLPAVMIFICGTYIARAEILGLLYDAAYKPGDSLFTLQLYGDSLALLCIPFSLILLAMVDTKKFIMAELLATLSYIVAIHLFPPTGIKILLYAYFIRYLIYLTLVVSFSRKHWKIV